MGVHGAHDLLIHILDPNRVVEARYIQYVAMTKAGLSLSGVLTAESSTSITLVAADGGFAIAVPLAGDQDRRIRRAVREAIELLDQGRLRVAEKVAGEWITHQWIKKAVLLSFRIEDNSFIKGGFSNYFDKVPSKFADYSSRDFRDGGFRVVPPAAVRKGAFIASNVVLMPSYVNIGAYVDEAVAAIHFDGMQYRRDIGWRALARK